MEKLGKLTFRFATESDRFLVKEFCDSQNFSNNISLEKMKWDWCLNVGAWSIALDKNKIISIAGIHPLSELGENSYRCLFRGAQLPGYTLGTGRDIFKTGIHLAHLLPMQIRWAPPNANLYITTNINNDGGKSQRMNNIIMPLLEKRKIWKHDRTMILYNVPQKIWRIDIERYFKERALSIGEEEDPR